VIFVFLGSLRATLIPAVAIPVSIIGTFTVTYILGFSINILTLLALVLAIGLVVDDAIVMLENVYRHLEMGKSRMRAALDGAVRDRLRDRRHHHRAGRGVRAGRVPDRTRGRLFNEFGLTVAVSVLISGFVALTLTPMLCSRTLRRHGTRRERRRRCGRCRGRAPVSWLPTRTST
jgi:multidrug efflux pump